MHFRLAFTMGFSKQHKTIFDCYFRTGELLRLAERAWNYFIISCKDFVIFEFDKVFAGGKPDVQQCPEAS